MPYQCLDVPFSSAKEFFFNPFNCIDSLNDLKPRYIVSWLVAVVYF